MENILEIRGLCKHYKGFSLTDVDIEVPYGSIVGFIGENGAGKSTTIKAVLDLIHRDAGEIRLFGLDNRAQGLEVKQRLGVVFDESSFPALARPRAIDRIMKNIYANWQSEQFFDWCRRFKLPDDKPFKEYSRGMKMKLSIAVALSHGAELLLLDEATSGLDPIVRDEILDVFFDFIQDERHSIFISSHIIGDLEKVADYIVFLHEGRVVFSAAKDDLREAFGLLHCTAAELAALDPAAIVGTRRGEFGVEALVRRALLPPATITEPASIEDIMVFHVRGDR